MQWVFSPYWKWDVLVFDWKLIIWRFIRSFFLYIFNPKMQLFKKKLKSLIFAIRKFSPAFFALRHFRLHSVEKKIIAFLEINQIMKQTVFFTMNECSSIYCTNSKWIRPFEFLSVTPDYFIQIMCTCLGLLGALFLKQFLCFAFTCCMLTS